MDTIVILCALVLIALGIRQFSRKEHGVAVLLWVIGVILLSLMILDFTTAMN